MKLTRQEILLLGALILALTAGAVVKHYRTLHPAPPPTPSPARKGK